MKFEQGDALLVVDVLSDFEHDDAASLLASFRERGPRIAEAIEAAREAGVPVVYVNDDRDRWDSDAPALASAFDHTALELLLTSLGARRVLLVGTATEGCIVQTAIDAREYGLKATILPDACATTDPSLEAVALAYAEDVGGIRVERAHHV